MKTILAILTAVVGAWCAAADPVGVTVNGTDAGEGSGRGWRCADDVLTLSEARDYTLSGLDTTGRLRVEVTASATVTLNSLTLILVRNAYCIAFTSGASDAKLVLTGDNRVYAQDVYPAVYIYSGAQVTLSGSGALVGGRDGNVSSRGVNNIGTFVIDSGTIRDYCVQHHGGAVFNSGTFTMNGGTLSGNVAYEGGALFNQGTARVYGGTVTDNEASGREKAYGGFCSCSDNGHIDIYGGIFSGNKASTGKCNLFYWSGDSRKSDALYGGVFAADPTAEGESNGCLLPQAGAAVEKVGENYVVGRSVTQTAGRLTGGIYTFDPTEPLYAEAGVALADLYRVVRSGTGYAVVREIGIPSVGLVNEAIAFHGFLKNPDGSPLDANSVVRIDFKLYSAAGDGAELLWARRIPVTIDSLSGYYVDIADTAGQSYQAPGGVKPSCATLRDAFARHAQLSPGPIWLAYEPVSAKVTTPFPRVPLHFQPIAQRASTAGKATVAAVTQVETATLSAAPDSTVTADRLVVDADLMRLNGLTYDVPQLDVELNPRGSVKIRNVTGLASCASTNLLGALAFDLPATADSDCGRVIRRVVGGVETMAAIYYSKDDATTLPEGATNVYVWSFGPLVEAK